MMPLIALKTGAAKISEGGDKPAGFQLLTAFICYLRTRRQS